DVAVEGSVGDGDRGHDESPVRMVGESGARVAPAASNAILRSARRAQQKTGRAGVRFVSRSQIAATLDGLLDPVAEPPLWHRANLQRGWLALLEHGEGRDRADARA